MSGLSRYGSERVPWSASSRGDSQASRFRLLACVLLLVALAGCSGRPNVFSEPRDERLRRLDEERARLARTTDAVGRTQVQIRISDLLISFMGDAVGDGDFERLEGRLDEYRMAVTDARDTMMNSGRDAARRANGFRELEITLRRHLRQLEDIGSQLTFQFREPIDQLITDVSAMRSELLDALFPPADEV